MSEVDDNLIVYYEELIKRAKAKESLFEFTKQAWSLLEGGKPFIDGWHIQAICEHLEAVSKGEIRNLLINMPPRHSKSSLISVMWPTWHWISTPNSQFLYGSYSLQLALRDSVRCRRLIESNWYKSRWGDIFRLVGDQNTKIKFENNRTGFRMCTSPSGSSTGDGGDFVVCDDPNNAKDGESDALRRNVLNWWDAVLPSRVNNPKTVAKVVTQQRIHQSDVSGHIIDNDHDDRWVKLILPAEYETSRKSKTIILPSSNGKIWEDPRTVDGELLWPSHYGQKEIAALKSELKTQYRIAGQLQQRPAPEEGGLLKKHYFKWWKQPKSPNLIHTIQSWDTALESSKSNCYSACTTWGIFKDDNEIYNLILLSLWRGMVEYPELRKMAQRLYYDYMDDNINSPIKPDGSRKPDVCLIEAKASGTSLVHDLIRAGIPATKFNPNKFGDKIQRVRVVSHLIEAGRVWVPARPPDYTRLRSFADVMVESCAIFPNSDSRDLVDTMTQVLLRLNLGGWLSNPSDDNTMDTSVSSPREAYY